MKYTNIICGSSPMTHYVPTGVTTPFTLDWSPLNTDNTNVLLPAFGVSDDYRQI